jgi:hypothetical protein
MGNENCLTGAFPIGGRSGNVLLSTTLTTMACNSLNDASTGNDVSFSGTCHCSVQTRPRIHCMSGVTGKSTCMAIRNRTLITHLPSGNPHELLGLVVPDGRDRQDPVEVVGGDSVHVGAEVSRQVVLEEPDPCRKHVHRQHLLTPREILEGRPLSQILKVETKNLHLNNVSTKEHKRASSCREQ